jgi:hypothetical protein
LRYAPWYEWNIDDSPGEELAYAMAEDSRNFGIGTLFVSGLGGFDFDLTK